MFEIDDKIQYNIYIKKKAKIFDLHRRSLFYFTTGFDSLSLLSCRSLEIEKEVARAGSNSFAPKRHRESETPMAGSLLAHRLLPTLPFHAAPRLRLPRLPPASSPRAALPSNADPPLPKPRRLPRLPRICARPQEVLPFFSNWSRRTR